MPSRFSAPLILTTSVLSVLAGAQNADAQQDPLAVAQAIGAASAHTSHARHASLEHLKQREDERAKARADEQLYLKREAALEARLGIQFYKIGEDWRAVTAMQRYQLIERSKPAAYLSGLIIGQIYHRNGRHKFAAVSFEQAVLAAPDGVSRTWSYLLETQQICAALDYWAECRWRLDQLAPLRESMPEHLREVYDYTRMFNAVMLRERPSPEAAQSFKDEELREHAIALLEQRDAFDELKLKRPGLAAGLSAVLPGAGQLYNGRYRDAAIAFSLNAAFGAATYYSFAELESIPLGVLSSLLLASFYTGNIYNAFTDARRINARRYETFFTDLKQNHWARVGFEVERNRVRFGVTFDWPGLASSQPDGEPVPPSKDDDSSSPLPKEDMML